MGGIDSVYLFPFVKYRQTEIITNKLELISFPATNIYRFFTNKQENFSQKMTSDDGGKYYNQSITLQFNLIKNGELFQNLLKKDYRLIIKDNNKNYRLLGALNGLECDSLESNTGGGKSDFNGFTVVFSGKELKEAFFIKDLQNTGFTIN